MNIDVKSKQFKSTALTTHNRSSTVSSEFRSHCPEDKKFKIDDLMSFRRGRGDLVFSVFVMLTVLFFLAMFWQESGWDKRKIPESFGNYMLHQFGLGEYEGKLTRFGRILKQSWVAPITCLLILVPAAVLNLRTSVRTLRWRNRFQQPTGVKFELEQWLRAIEFVMWFIVYTLLVPVLGYLVSTLLLGTLLPWRMGYRSARWMGICVITSIAIVLLFRTGLQIKTPVNIWLYGLLPTELKGFMQTWF